MESAAQQPGEDEDEPEPFLQLGAAVAPPDAESDDEDQEVVPIAGANEPDVLTSRDDSAGSAQRADAEAALKAAAALAHPAAEAAKAAAEAMEDPAEAAEAAEAAMEEDRVRVEVPHDTLPVSSSSEPPLPQDLPPPLDTDPPEQAPRLRSVSQESPRPPQPTDATQPEEVSHLPRGTRVFLSGGSESVGAYNGHAGVVQAYHETAEAYTVQLDSSGPQDLTVLQVSRHNVTAEAEGSLLPPLSLALPVQDVQDTLQDSSIARDPTLQSVGRSSELDTLHSLHINPGSILGRVLLAYCSQVAKRPKRLLFLYILCAVVPLVVGILFRGFALETDFNAFIKADGSAMRDREAYQLAYEEKKDLTGGRRLEEVQPFLQVDEWIEEVEAEDAEGVRRLLEENYTTAPGRRLRTLFLRKELQLLYRAKNGNILDDKALQDIQAIEEGFRTLPGVRNLCYTRITSESKRFLCDPGISLVAMAFPTQSSSSQGRAFLEFTWDGMGRDLVPPAAVLAYMKTAAEYGDSSRTSRRYFPKTWTYPDVGDFQAESAMPDAARTKFSYHLTLGQNGDPVSQVNANIGKTKEEWNKLITTEMLPYFHKVQSEQVEFYYASTDIDSIEINSTLFNDLLMAIGSIAFVILYLRIHTGGWVVSISSFLIIFISVPLAYIMTPAAKATIASFLSVFLITGIGCDVVFVFTDFWEQGHKLPMESRVMWMIVHGGESCLATSMTTALSFFANLASALQPLREFGMFMGLCVMCAFFLVLLMIPPLLVAIERRKEMVKLRVVDISSGQGVAAYEEKKKKKKDGVMNALLFHLMNGIARCPCMVVLTTFVFFITAAVGVVVTAKLSTGVPDIFPPSHNQVANKAVLDLFSTEANLQYPAPSSGLICNADTVNGTDTGNCQLHWCEAVSDGLGSTTTTSTGLTSQMSCWRSPTLKLDGSTKISIGYSTEGCWDVNIYARVAMEQVSNAAFNRTLVLALEDELGPAGYTHLPPSVSSLRPLIVEKWEDGSVEAVKFWQARTFTATAPFRGQVDVRNTTEDLCELHVLCFKEEGYQCGISGWKRLGSAAYPLARRLSPVFAPFSRRLQGELVTQTVPTPVDVTVIWGIRSARSTPLVGPPSEFWSYDPNFVPQNPWAQRAIRNMCSGLTKNLKVFRAKCWISLFETYLNQQNKRFPSRTFDGDVIGWYYSNTVEAQAHLWFQDRKVIACKLQFLVNVGIYVPSSQGLLYMKEWDSFVEGKNAVASMTANRAWHTASIWVRSEAEVAIIGSTIDTIIIATCSGWAGVFLFTGDLWLAVIVTCVVIVVITGLAFYISCIMAWSIGPIEVISLVVFVGYSVTYALHIAHNYNQMRDSDKDLLEAEAKVRKRKMARAKAQAARKRAAAAAAGADEDLEDLQAAVQLDLPEQELRLEDITFTPAQLREARTRVAVLHVGGATLSSALSTAGSSAFLLLCTLTIFVKLGGVVVAVTVLSILGAIVTLPAALMLVGPAPDAWYKQKVRRLLQMLMGGKAQDQEPLLDSDLGSPSPKDPSELY